MKSERARQPELVQLEDLNLPEVSFSTDAPGVITSFTHVEEEIIGSRSGSLWRNLMTRSETSPYCPDYTKFWKFPVNNADKTYIERIPTFIVNRSSTDTPILTSVGTNNILFKAAGEYDSGMYIDVSTDYYIPFRVSPVIIGMSNNLPVFDYKRFHRPTDSHVPGIALISPVSAEFLGLSQNNLKRWSTYQQYFIESNLTKPELIF